MAISRECWCSFGSLVQLLHHFEQVVKGPFKCYVRQVGVGGGVKFLGEKRYRGVRFNVISITRGGWGSNFQEKSVM